VTWLVAIFLGVMLLGFIGTLLKSPPSPPSASRAAAPVATDKLELLNSRGYDEHGYHFVEGQVKNISDQSLKNVEVMVQWFTNKGDLVKTDDALISYNPILPGQISPFKSITTSNPEMTRYTVSFKTLFGAEIATKDSRKR
jgi:hypothetical protein